METRNLHVVVLGGGFVGWLAGWLRPDAMVLDWRRAPASGSMHTPRFMGAMYLHEPLEGLTCDPFTVRTSIDGEPATYNAAAAYKHKIGKPYDMDSPTWKAQFPMLAQGFKLKAWPEVTVHYGHHVKAIDPVRKLIHYHTPPKGQGLLRYDVLISAIPLPSLLEYIRQPAVGFQSHPIAIRAIPAPPDVPLFIREHPETMFVDYRSSPHDPIYRITDYQGLRYYEWLAQDHRFLGIPTKVIKPGKLYTHPGVERILMDLNAVQIYPFGRPGRWAPNELLHDAYRDMVTLFQHLEAA